jgi:aminoglycoside phosphotransferase (APT) family kinase protein
LALHDVRGSWSRLPSSGIANRIYATQDVVLRIATDHEDGVADARTESVAAPVAWAAGIRTPRLLAFDDSRKLVDRPYSLWERIHGVTADELTVSAIELWRSVGREIARLHTRVRACSDPQGWLDHPEHGPPPQRFVHDDLHGANIMCSPEGVFLGFIDWGDAGWGDPMLDFAYLPDVGVEPALDAYGSEATGALNADALARLARHRKARSAES